MSKQTYKLEVSVEAYSKQEAQAKLNVLMQLGAFLKDYNVTNLGLAALELVLISYAAKKGIEVTSKKEDPKMTLNPNNSYAKKAEKEDFLLRY